jgi:hypothetical protein
MTTHRSCDFCGRSETELALHMASGSSAIEVDEDGLWVCWECRPTLVLPPVGDESGDIEELQALVGKSAGAICYTLNLPYDPPFRSIIDAASKIAYDEDRYMSTWTFVAEWQDGTTVVRRGGPRNSSTSVPSTPGLPRFACTRYNATTRLSRSHTSSIRRSLSAGPSVSLDATAGSVAPTEAIPASPRLSSAKVGGRWIVLLPLSVP